MIRREMMKNSHDMKSSIHLVSDKTTNTGENVSICTDLLKNYEIAKDVVNLIDIPNRAIISADIMINLDYIENETYMKLTTNVNGINDILIKIDEELLVDSLIECVNHKKIASKTEYLGSLKDDLLKQLQSVLLKERGQLITFSEALVAYIEVFNNKNELVGKANRFNLVADINSLKVVLCEYLGHNPMDNNDDYDNTYRIEFYIGAKKIVLRNINFDEIQTHNSKMSYAHGTGYRTNLSITNGDISLYEKALASIKQLKLEANTNNLSALIKYLQNNNTTKSIMSYIRKNKLKFGANEIDINKYLLEELI